MHHSPASFLRIAPALLVTAAASLVSARASETGPSLRGSRPLVPYEGAQPALVSGASEAPATAAPVVRHAYAVRSDVLALTVDARFVERRGYVPYKAEPGDRVSLQGYEVRLDLAEAAGIAPWIDEEHRKTQKAKLFPLLQRENRPVGAIVGPKRTELWLADRIRGERLDPAWASTPANYRVTSPDDPAFAEGVAPAAVHRKGWPVDAGLWSGETMRTLWTRDFVERHEIYLELPRPLAPGKTYKVEFARAPGGITGPVTVLFDDRRLRSEAIQVNLAGYHPAHPDRVAYVSTWMGDGGALVYPNSNFRYEVVEDDSGRTVAAGSASLLAEAGKPAYLGGSAKTPVDPYRTAVYGLDLSIVSEPGVYRVVVPGVGSSFPFRISDRVWTDMLQLQMLGFLHQRSGLELGPPLTSFKRPRDFHPEDGRRVHLTDPKRFGGEGLTHHPFARIQRSIRLDSHHPGAWGGWHDAADFDRSLLPQRHNFAVHVMLDLHESNPRASEAFRARQPEAGNGIPALLNEALWCMDLFLRVQQEDGGIPSAVESIEHPAIGENSWNDSLPVALTPPTPQTCHIYAAAAAKLSRLLRPYDAVRAERYAKSALRAMAWAEANASEPNLYVKDRTAWTPSDRTDLNQAAIELYLLTKDSRWLSVFADTVWRNEEGRIAFSHEVWAHEMPGYAAYALARAPGLDPDIQKACRDAIVSLADSLLVPAAETPHRAIRPAGWHLFYALTPAWNVGAIVTAHRLTGDQRYLDALAASAQYALGANPHNLGLTSGLGPRSVRPHHKSFTLGGTEVPDGLPMYENGLGTISRGKSIVKNVGPFFHPQWADWPDVEGLVNVRYPLINEHTIGGMARHLAAWGYLAFHLPPAPAAPAKP